MICRINEQVSISLLVVAIGMSAAKLGIDKVNPLFFMDHSFPYSRFIPQAEELSLNEFARLNIEIQE